MFWRLLKYLTHAGSKALAVLLPMLAVAACGSDVSGPEPRGLSVVASVQVEEGEGQRGAPEQAMPDSIVARVTDSSGNAVEGRLVNFEVVGGSENGQFEASALTSNGNGRVMNELRAGPRAWTSRIVDGQDSAATARLVASNKGQPDSVTTFTFAVEVGPVHEASFGGLRLNGSDGALVIDLGRRLVVDEWNNPVPFDLEVPGDFATTSVPRPGTGARRIEAVAIGCGEIDARADGSTVGYGVVQVTDGGSGTGEPTDITVDWSEGLQDRSSDIDRICG